MDRRARYLDIAFSLFSEHGFNGVSMDQVVALTGGSKATLYRYFPSKDALFEAMIDDIATVVAGPADEDWNGVELSDGLRTVARAVVAGAMSERTAVLLRLALGEFGRFPQLARTLFEHGPGVSYARLSRFLAAKQAEGTVAIDDVQIAAEQFIGAIVGHQQLRVALGVDHATPAGMEARIEAAITAFIATYAGPARPRPAAR